MMTDQEFEAWMAIDPEAALAAQAAQYDTPRRVIKMDPEIFYACRGELMPAGHQVRPFEPRHFDDSWIWR